MELILELPAEESKCSASFFLFTYSLSSFATSTADIFMVVELRHLRECTVYTGVLYPKEIAQGPRNHIWLRHFSSSGDGFWEGYYRCLETEWSLQWSWIALADWQWCKVITSEDSLFSERADKNFLRQRSALWGGWMTCAVFYILFNLPYCFVW